MWINELELCPTLKPFLWIVPWDTNMRKFSISVSVLPLYFLHNSFLIVCIHLMFLLSVLNYLLVCYCSMNFKISNLHCWLSVPYPDCINKRGLDAKANTLQMWYYMGWWNWLRCLGKFCCNGKFCVECFGLYTQDWTTTFDYSELS